MTIEDITADAESDLYGELAEQILAERGARKSRLGVDRLPDESKVQGGVIEDPPGTPRGGPRDPDLAGAYAEGFWAGADAVGECCGCGIRGEHHNSYDGSRLT